MQYGGGNIAADGRTGANLNCIISTAKFYLSYS